MEPAPGTAVEQCVIDLLPAGILIFNTDGSIHTMNRAARKIATGLCNPDLIRSWDDLVLLFDIEETSPDNTPSRNEKTIGDNTYVVYPLMVATTGDPVRLVYIADITEEKRIIQDIHKKTSSILIGIRTRVTGIQNGLGLVLDYRIPVGESAGLVKDSRYEIWLLSRHADNLKDLSLSQANTLAEALYIQPVLLFRLVKEAIDNTSIFRAYNNNTVTIDNSVPDRLSVRCDRMRMIKVIESVLLNALIYAGPHNHIDIGAELDDRWATLKIQDRGFGIPLEDQQRMFEYRFRGKNKDKVKYNGMGIELYLARLNVACQEGTISFTSKEGIGACFEISLKRDDPAIGAKTTGL
jgi:signal transduction histidine kinase